MSRIFDFPESFQNDENAILLIDANNSVYQPNDVSDGVVYVEKYLVRKGKFRETERLDENEDLVASTIRPNAFLVDETNFQDIGGGLQTFERHYATFPSSWYDFQEVSYRTVYWGAINWRSRSGTGATWQTERKVLAKATRYYLKHKDVPTDKVPEDDLQATKFADRFDIYYAFEPEGRLGRNWEDYIPDPNNPTKVVIAPDSIRKYMGYIYEFTRYTIEI
jgi:hypothetical protein